MSLTKFTATGLAGLALSAAAHAAELEVAVEGLRSETGQVLIALHDRPDGFPSGWDKALRVARVPADAAAATARFAGLAPGRYAVIAVHDEDGDGAMSKTVIGWPKEGFGVSNNPRFFGPPRYRAAEFTLDADAAQRIRLAYF